MNIYNYDYRVQDDLEIVQNLTIEKTVSGTQVLTYCVSKVNWNGESLPTSVVVTDGPNLLSSSATVKLSWERDPEVDYYKVFGRVAGLGFGFIANVDLPDQESVAPSFLDDGSIPPDITKPLSTENTTGRTEWDRFLFKDGRNLQAAELNDIQILQAQYLEQLSNSLYTNGTVISGCATSAIGPGVVAIGSGLVFISSKVRNTETATISGVPLSGNSEVGLQVETVIVNGQEDSALKDPAINARNYNNIGADVIKINLTWCCNGSGMIPMFNFTDGTFVSKINKTIEERIYALENP